MLNALGIRFQVNQHSALRGHIARHGIVLKVISMPLVEAAGVLAVDDDLDVVQIRQSTRFELHCLRSADRELSAPLDGLRDGKAFGGLLNVQAEFRRKRANGLAHTPLRVEIHSRDRSNHQNRDHGEPAPQA